MWRKNCLWWISHFNCGAFGANPSCGSGPQSSNYCVPLGTDSTSLCKTWWSMLSQSNLRMFQEHLVPSKEIWPFVQRWWSDQCHHQACSFDEWPRNSAESNHHISSLKKSSLFTGFKSLMFRPPKLSKHKIFIVCIWQMLLSKINTFRVYIILVYILIKACYTFENCNPLQLINCPLSHSKWKSLEVFCRELHLPFYNIWGMIKAAQWLPAL